MAIEEYSAAERFIRELVDDLETSLRQVNSLPRVVKGPLVYLPLSREQIYGNEVNALVLEGMIKYIKDNFPRVKEIPSAQADHVTGNPGNDHNGDIE